MKYLLFIALIMISMACQPPQQELSDSQERVEQSVYGMVSRHPNDSKALEAAFEESNYFDTALDAALGRLIEKGRVVVTEKGVKAVPTEDWPESD